MTPPQITPDLIAKLPKWAQEHIADLQRQRDAAIEALENIVDTQTPSHGLIHNRARCATCNEVIESKRVHEFCGTDDSVETAR